MGVKHRRQASDGAQAYGNILLSWPGYIIVYHILYKYRTLRGYSQPDLSRELALEGVTLYNNDIYKIEHNKRTVKDYELYALMKVLNVTFEEMTNDSEKLFIK